MTNLVRAEFRKLLALPASLVAIAGSVLVTLVLAVVNAIWLRGALDRGDSRVAAAGADTIDAGLELLLVGTVGAIVLGVVIISSEYTTNSQDVGGGRQILTSLTCAPRRGRLLAAKVVVLVVTNGVLAAVTVPAAVLLSQALLGAHGHPVAEVVDRAGWRIVGGVVFWVLTALLACAVTVLTRSGIVPLAVFIANTSVVSVSLLLTRVTGLARYLPDVAGAQMVNADYPAENMLGPVAGGLVMAAWAAGLLAVAAVVFARRDA